METILVLIIIALLGVVVVIFNTAKNGRMEQEYAKIDKWIEYFNLELSKLKLINPDIQGAEIAAIKKDLTTLKAHVYIAKGTK